jgi:hypothetical protein
MMTSKKNGTPKNGNSKKGRRTRESWTPEELLMGARVLRDTLDLALRAPRSINEEQWDALSEALTVYLDKSRWRRSNAWALIVVSVAIARGADVAEQLRRAEPFAHKKYDDRTVISIRRVLDRAGKTEMGRAYAVFQVVSKGVACEPAADTRRAPRRGSELESLFRAALKA